jgi:ankyrin repeat protein
MRRAGFLGWLASGVLAAQTGRVDFVRDVQPILREHCVECHGPTQQMRGLRLDRRSDAIPNRVGANRASIVPGRSAASPLYLRVTGTQPGVRMPPPGPLRPELIGTLKAWIDQGAEWPDAAANDAAAAAPDPGVGRIMNALRRGDVAEFKRLLTGNPEAVNRKGQGGWTPLMYAALYGGADEVRLLLDKGVDAKARNEAGGTALLYAIDSPEKTALLLARGAEVNARSGEGRTALLIAAGRPGSSAVVKLLLEKGADVNARLTDGRGALSLAAGASDADTIQALLSRGAEAKPAPLAGAIQTRCERCVQILLPLAGPEDLTAALSAAVRVGDRAMTGALLERGARAASSLLSAVALLPEAPPAGTLGALVERGADVNAKTAAGTVLELAKLQGRTPFAEWLVKAGARDAGTPAAPVLKAKAAASARAAVERSLPLLVRADAAFLERAGCVSCHNNSLAAMAMNAARKSGIRVDPAAMPAHFRRITAFLDANRERGLEGVGLPGGVDTVGYILLGLAEAGYPGDPITDVWAVYLKDRQMPDGRWSIQTLRPPLEASEIQVTAAAMRALQRYGAPSRRREYDGAVARAVRWLETAQPKTNEDRTFQILGLVWGGGSRERIREAAGELAALGRPDGGWAQTATLASDAYATGQALTALVESGVVKPDTALFRRGIRFLLNSQLEDGSWYVRTRAIPIQPHFDSDFPHGKDQFISAAASNWASIALAIAAREEVR